MVITLNVAELISNPFIYFICILMSALIGFSVYIEFIKIVNKIIRFQLKNFDEETKSVVSVFATIGMSFVYCGCIAYYIISKFIK